MNFTDKNTPKPDIVFITGGSGFIGSRIIKVFVQHPTDVTEMCIESSASILK